MTLKHLRLSLLSAFAALTLSASATVSDADIRYGTLPNGLTYYIRHNEKPVATADFFIAERVGSICEDENQRGLAHFLEHMCFNGTQHFPGNSLIKYLEGIGVRFGADLNAYTSTDETVYNICNVPTARQSAVDSCLLILHDWSCAITLDPKDIDEERGVILGEMRQRKTASTRILTQVAPEVYPGSRYGVRLPIGLQEVVESFPTQRLVDFYHRWYGPTNQAIVIVGDIDVDAVEASMKRIFADVAPGGEPVTDDIMAVPGNDRLIVSAHSDPEQTASMVQLHFKHGQRPLDNDTLYMRDRLLYSLLADMLVGRFDVMEETAACPHSRMALGDTKFFLSRGQRSFMLRGFPKKGQTTNAIKLWRAELLRAVRDGFTADEYERSVGNLKRQLGDRLDGDARATNTQRARTYVRHFLDGGPLMSAKDYNTLALTLLPTISAEEAHKALTEIVNNDEGKDAVIILYERAEEGVPATTDADLRKAFANARTLVNEMTPFQLAAIPDKILPIEPKPGRITSTDTLALFDAKVYNLSNGLRVVARQSNEVKDQIYVRGVGYGGISQVYDVKDVPTLKIINEIIASSGSGNYTTADLRRMIQGRQIKVSLSMNVDESTVEVATSPADFTDAMRLMHLRLTSLTPDTVAISNFLNSERQRLAGISTNPSQVMGDSIHNMAYCGHPLALKLSPEKLDMASPELALDIARKRFGDLGGFTFYVTGDFNPDSLAYCLEHYVANLHATKHVVKPRDIGYGYPTKARTNEFTRHMVTPQAVVYTIFTGECPYSAENLVNATAFGNILKARLLEDIREKRGWTYSVMSHCAVNAHPGGTSPSMLMLPVNITVAPENADATAQIVAQTAEDIAKNGCTPEELKRVREQLGASVKESLKSNAFWLSAMRIWERDGVDMRNGYANAVNALTSDTIADFARRYVSTAARSVLIMRPEK